MKSKAGSGTTSAAAALAATFSARAAALAAAASLFKRAADSVLGLLGAGCVSESALRFAGLAGSFAGARTGLGFLGHFLGLGFFTPDVRDGFDGRNILLAKKTQRLIESQCVCERKKKTKLFFSEHFFFSGWISAPIFFWRKKTGARVQDDKNIQKISVTFF
jgi:hypothetical protein